MAKVIATLEIKNAAKMAVETIYGIQIISDEVRALDLRYKENENENPRTD